MDKKIPEETIIRLSYYLRALIYFLEEKKKVVSSRQLADFLKISHHQLRKDLSYFGHFGKKGVGYSCLELIDRIKEILGLNQQWNVCVVGFGNLGRALSFYKGFRDQGICIKAAFDVDKNKQNKTYNGIKIYGLEKLQNIIKKENIRIAIITVPKENAKEISDNLYRCGIRAILNFAPVKLALPQDIILKDVDFSCQLTYLTYRLKLLERVNLQ
ncbi:MAG: redox-sensing transcriptional repressor Rex [Candidatus Omnitrophica bacterium]|jgi:redox-sensing transcriptional repressor|nr:redox-sensing transcriptional repressor Rex [Candidatus Omnitrophota bacterium]